MALERGIESNVAAAEQEIAFSEEIEQKKIEKEKEAKNDRKAGQQQKNTIHLPWGDWMRDTGEEEKKESEKIKRTEEWEENRIKIETSYTLQIKEMDNINAVPTYTPLPVF